MSNKVINQRVANYFNKKGENYSNVWGSVAKKRLCGLELEFIRKGIYLSRKNSINKKLKTLDIGIGLGRISEVVLEFSTEHYGIDISKTMVDFCVKKFKRNNKIRKLLVHDATYPFSKSWKNFDLVTSIRVLSYTPSWKKSLINIYQVLKPGGIFIFTFPNKYSSMVIPKIIFGKKYLGYEISYKKLSNSLKEVGFSVCEVWGFPRLLDSFYDWCNDNLSTTILFGIEKFLTLILGQKLFAREFYIICKK